MKNMGRIKKKKSMNPRNKVLAGSMAYGTKTKSNGRVSMMRGTQVLKKPGHGKKVSAPRGRY